MNKYIKKYNKENVKRLRTLQSKRPKDYWKLLNRIKSKSNVEHPDLQDLNTEEQRNDPDINVNDIYTNLNANNHLNAPFTSVEIDKCIKLLKNNKSPGIDKVLNENIKCTKTQMLPIYVKLFNIILETVYIPSNWSEGMIIRIFKNKGDSKDPEKYRPIIRLSCVGKLFISILNERLKQTYKPK